MHNKRFFAVVSICFAVLLSCGGGRQNKSREMPESIKNAVRNAPEDVVLGIGYAKTESDGESILMAQEFAIEDIAKQLNQDVQNFLRDYEDEDKSIKFNEDILSVRTSEVVSGARIEVLEKGDDGSWWCLVSASQPKIKMVPAQIYINTISEKPYEASAVYSKAAIPDWVKSMKQDVPEDCAFGLGAAKLENDDDSILLAKERARRSLVWSIETDVTSLTIDYSLRDNQDSLIDNYQRYAFSSVSVYNHVILDSRVERLEKTKDGTWWVLLYCPVKKSWASNFNAEERMNEAFRKAFGE